MSVASQPPPTTGQPVGAAVDASPARRPEPVTLAGRFGRLERLDSSRHGADLWAAVKGHDALWTYVPFGPFADAAAFRAWLDGRTRLDDPYSYAILDGSDRAVGVATLMEIRPVMRVIEVGSILYGAPLQRTPLATEAQYLLARYAFETLHYRRYEWKCDALNAASRRAAERFGFTFEGIFRSHMIVKGRSRDTAWFAMLDTEWPARKRAFEGWLDPANFDAQGRQRATLAALAAGADVSASLRRAGAADLAAVTALQHAAYAKNRAILGVEPAPLAADYAKVLAEHEVWLAEGSRGLEGVLILEPRADDLLIWSVATAPEAQGRGIGDRLLVAAEQRARVLGLAIVRLYTGERLTSNIAWYARRGFVPERVEELDDRRVVHMLKRIAEGHEQ